MYVQNTTRAWRCFAVGTRRYNLSPAGQKGCTALVPDSAKDDPQVAVLLDRGHLKVLGGVVEADRVEAEAPADPKAAQKEKMKVVDYRRNTEVKNVAVRCAAKTKAGAQCSNNVFVVPAEYDESRPYFCPRHRNERPEDYSKVDGAWVKGEAAAPAAVVDARPREESDGE